MSRQQIYKRIESGEPEAICLGSRLYRIRTAVARAYEGRATVNSTTREVQAPPANPTPMPSADKFPKKIGLQRVR